MTGENKKLSEKPFVVFLLALLILAVLLTTFAVIAGQGSLNLIGSYFLVGGIIVAGIAFAFINKGKGNGWDGYNQSEYARSDEYFKRVRAQEKPFERIVWAVMLAAISLAIVGYFLNKL